MILFNRLSSVGLHGRTIVKGFSMVATLPPSKSSLLHYLISGLRDGQDALEEAFFSTVHIT